MTKIEAEPAPAGKIPGSGLSPRQRQRISRAVQYAVFVVIVVVAILMADWKKIHEDLLDTNAIKDMFPDLFTVGMKNTILYTAAAYAVGFVVGLIIALMRLSSVAPYRWFGLIFIEIFRGLPALLILVLVAFGLPIA